MRRARKIAGLGQLTWDSLRERLRSGSDMAELIWVYANTELKARVAVSEADLRFLFNQYASIQAERGLLEGEADRLENAARPPSALEPAVRVFEDRIRVLSQNVQLVELGEPQRLALPDSLILPEEPAPPPPEPPPEVPKAPPPAEPTPVTVEEEEVPWEPPPPKPAEPKPAFPSWAAGALGLVGGSLLAFLFSR